jgi:phospholipase C
MVRWHKAASAAVVFGLTGLAIPSAVNSAGAAKPPAATDTTTPIKHLVVIFQENVSFDHYFGTYPQAANTAGQKFDAAKNTPTVNGLVNTPGLGGAGNLLTNNPNVDSNGTQVNPRRPRPGQSQ